MHEAEQYLRNPEKPYKLYIRYNGSRRKLFLNEKDGPIGIINKGKKKHGTLFNDWSGITQIYTEEIKKNKVEIQRKLVCKYKREAEKATFTNPFIRKCLSADENKSLYENHITTGVSIEGEIITLEAIKKYVGAFEIDAFRKALKEKRRYTSGRFNFRGYDGSLEISVVAEGDSYHKAGDVMGYFSKEYKGCLNGYYYLLINDEKFIGYDID